MNQKFESFTASISRAYRCVQKIKSMEMTEFGLKGGHVMCLFYLYRHPEGLTVSELSRFCDTDKAAISRAVTEIEERGYVVCQQAGERKKYRAKLSLTASGQQISAQVEQIIEDAVSRGGEGLTEERRAVFYQTLEQIGDNLQAICDERKEES